MNKQAMVKYVLGITFLAGGVSMGAEQPAKQPSEAKATTRPTRQDVKVPAFEKLMNEKHPVLDVRTPGEFAAGHLRGAINIDVNAPDFDKQIAKLDKSKTYLVHCKSGVRSVRACDKLSRAGFANLVNLEGGIKAWQQAGKEVVTGK